MIYLPKPHERYLAALRLYIQKSVLRGGNTEKRLLQLKKIMLCEAILSKGDKEPLNIQKYSDSLLGAAVIILLQRGKRLSVRLSGGGAFLINRRLFTSLLLTAADNCGKSGDIFILAEEKRIVIKFKGISISGIYKTLADALGGTLLKTVRGDRAIIALPAEKTAEKPRGFQNEWSQLLDRFSPVNVFLLHGVK